MSLTKFRYFFSEGKFWKTLGRHAQAAGSRTAYTALLLYYAYQRKETPAWAKRVVMGALGYLVMPLDFVPDLSPVVGFTDDIGVLSAGLLTVAAFVNQEVRENARKKLGDWFPSVEEADLQSVEDKL